MFIYLNTLRLPFSRDKGDFLLLKRIFLSRGLIFLLRGYNKSTGNVTLGEQGIQPRLLA